MANSRSALKRVRQTATRTARNRVVKTNLKLAKRSFAEAIESGDSAKIKEAYDKASSIADKAAKKGLIHKNAASNTKSGMARAIAAASA